MQSFNLQGVMFYPYARFINPSLAVPHFSVKDIRSIQPDKLKYFGFKGCVFDKDNTITAPYINKIYPSIADAFEVYRRIFGNNIAILSNSAGTPDDKDYEDAKTIEKDLGIHVIIHKDKKPGGIAGVLAYYDCEPQQLAMFGDRIFTDIVFGNRYGMLTIHTAMLSAANDNKTAAKIRKLELPWVKKQIEKGIRAPNHLMYHDEICEANLFAYTINEP